MRWWRAILAVLRGPSMIERDAYRACSEVD
jgi:hypothetical protein